MQHPFICSFCQREGRSKKNGTLLCGDCKSKLGVVEKYGPLLKGAKIIKWRTDFTLSRNLDKAINLMQDTRCRGEQDLPSLCAVPTLNNIGPEDTPSLFYNMYPPGNNRATGGAGGVHAVDLENRGYR